MNILLRLALVLGGCTSTPVHREFSVRLGPTSPVFYDSPTPIAYEVFGAKSCGYTLEPSALMTELPSTDGNHRFEVTVRENSVVSVICSGPSGTMQASRTLELPISNKQKSTIAFSDMSFTYLLVVDSSTPMQPLLQQLEQAMLAEETLAILPKRAGLSIRFGVMNMLIHPFHPKDGATLPHEFAPSAQTALSRCQIPQTQLWHGSPSAVDIGWDLDVEYPGIEKQPGFGNIVDAKAWEEYMTLLFGTPKGGAPFSEFSLVATLQHRATTESQASPLVERIGQFEADGSGQLGALYRVFKNYQTKPCDDKFFALEQKSSAGAPCLSAALQIPPNAIDIEPGIVAFDQLINRYQGQAIFPTQSRVHVVFVSNGQDPGMTTRNQGTGYSLDGVGADRITVDGNLLPYTDYLLSKMNFDYFYNRLRENSEIESLQFHGIIPVDRPCKNSDSFATATYQALISFSSGTMIDICSTPLRLTAGLANLFHVSRYASLIFMADRPIYAIDSIVEQNAMPQQMLDYQLSSDRRSVLVHGIDAMAASQIEIEASCFKADADEDQCRFERWGSLQD